MCMYSPLWKLLDTEAFVALLAMPSCSVVSCQSTVVAQFLGQGMACVLVRVCVFCALHVFVL